MTGYVARTGEVFTDDDITRWAADIEDGFPASTVTPVPPRAWESVQTPMVTRSVRVPTAFWEQVERAAHDHGITTSAYVRQALTHQLTHQNHAS